MHKSGGHYAPTPLDENFFKSNSPLRGALIPFTDKFRYFTKIHLIRVLDT